MEFKVYDPEDESDLKETVQAALTQIEEKQYVAMLTAKGIPENHIFKYGFAFHGKSINWLMYKYIYLRYTDLILNDLTFVHGISK